MQAILQVGPEASQDLSNIDDIFGDSPELYFFMHNQLGYLSKAHVSRKQAI